MKGIIFKLFEGFITDGWGEERYEQILSSSKLQTVEPFVGPETYPDGDLLTLVAQASGQLGIPVADAVHAFGKYCFPKLAAKFPMFVQGHTHPKTFLKTINTVIHTEVKKLYRDANPPEITFVDQSPDSLVLCYRSQRRLCALMAGLLEGTAEHFSTPMEYTQPQCMLRGAESCEFHLAFPSSRQEGSG